eukprot:TRINITY_DN7159_c0_g1_i1.p9 TRINITY_DN7159_c0_g1~~TRINITY_DN7159_c0_g1_i1.p9  ORF type:complete len:105 (-),score=7.98 TRINITY_DN7159_c0_g1_i1:889-1203(-)
MLWTNACSKMCSVAVSGDCFSSVKLSPRGKKLAVYRFYILLLVKQQQKSNKTNLDVKILVVCNRMGDDDREVIFFCFVIEWEIMIGKQFFLFCQGGQNTWQSVQ